MTNKELIDLCNERWDRMSEIYPENPCLGCEYGSKCDIFWLKYRDTPYKEQYSRLYTDEEISN